MRMDMDRCDDGFKTHPVWRNWSHALLRCDFVIFVNFICIVILRLELTLKEHIVTSFPFVCPLYVVLQVPGRNWTIFASINSRPVFSFFLGYLLMYYFR